jgi:hypothetical protein
MVNSLPSSFALLRFLSCFWQNSRREILRAKSPSPASTVKVEAAGDGGTTLISADGLYNGRSVSRQNQPGIKDSVERWRVCASTVDGPPLYWAIPSFLLKGIEWRGCAALFKAGLFAIRNGARGKEGARAGGELKTVRPGPRHENAFYRVKGKKRFGATAGRMSGFRSAQAAAAAGAGFRRFLFARCLDRARDKAMAGTTDFPLKRSRRAYAIVY